MKRILGLDLGTNSIGWAVVNEKENDNEKSEIIRLGVRVNPLTVDEKSNFSETAMKELALLTDAVGEILNITIDAFVNNDNKLVGVIDAFSCL